jgi:hypothetical protein
LGRRAEDEKNPFEVVAVPSSLSISDKALFVRHRPPFLSFSCMTHREPKSEDY